MVREESRQVEQLQLQQETRGAYHGGDDATQGQARMVSCRGRQVRQYRKG